MVIAPQAKKAESHDPRGADARPWRGLSRSARDLNWNLGETNMERETVSNTAPNNIVAVRRWLTLEQLLEVLPLKKSTSITSRTHVRSR
jgi:hypothetical protein